LKYCWKFRNQRRDGRGKYWYGDGGNYDGDFENNYKEGSGFGDSSLGKNDGEWCQSKESGEGTCFYNGDQTCEGLWKADKKEGKGAY
jgi:hypothetical protein